MYSRAEWLLMAHTLFEVARAYTNTADRQYYRQQARECLAEAGWHVV